MQSVEATLAARGTAAKKMKPEAGFLLLPNATPCQLPPESRLRDSLPRMDYLDSFEVPWRTPEKELVAIYAAALGHLPKVFKQLLVVRSYLVKPFGVAGVSYIDLARPIDTGRSYVVGDKIGRWTLFAKHLDELITGANDRHLDFRVSVFRDARPRIVLSTAVMTHNAFGRAYLATILPFHRFGVAKLLSNASATGQI
jgi:hypothetical protein